MVCPESEVSVDREILLDCLINGVDPRDPRDAARFAAICRAALYGPQRRLSYADLMLANPALVREYGHILETGDIVQGALPKKEGE